MFLLSLLTCSNNSAFHSQQVQILRQQMFWEILLLCLHVGMAMGKSLHYFLSMVSNYLPDMFGIVCLHGINRDCGCMHQVEMRI